MTTRRHFLRTGLGLLGAAGVCLAMPGDEGGGSGEALPDGANVKGLVDERTDKAIDRGLAYLGSSQFDDGSYGTGRWPKHAAITSLAALAFMAGGHQPNRGLYGGKVMRALHFILDQSGRDGTPGYLYNPLSSAQGPMYGHGFATLFLAEVSGMVHEAALRAKVDLALHRAVDLILRAQKCNLDRGWRYTPTAPDADLSVTVCQIMALRAARNAGVTVPKSQVDDCISYVKACQNRPDGYFRYMKGHGGPPGAGFARTAAGIVALNTAGIYKGQEIESALKYLKNYRPGGGMWVNPDMFYFYGHYYAVQAMYTAGGEYWADWYPRVRDELVPRQTNEGCWHDAVCPHYATAMACLVLQMPNNYLPILQK